MIKKHYFYLLVSLLIAFGLFLTTFKLNTIPNGFAWDEAANAYNSFSLLKTGKDEWGRSWPLFIKSFGDFKSGFLSYTIMPFFLVGGINQAMARMPVVLLAIAGVLGLIFLIKENSSSKGLALLSGLVLLTNPWFLHYARICFEPMPSLGLMLLGFWLWFNQDVKKKIVGSFLLILSMYVYHSARLFVPMQIFIYFLVFVGSSLRKYLKKYSISLILFILGTMVIWYGILFSNSGDRAKKVLFWDETELTTQVEEGIYRNRVLNYPFIRVFNNKAWVILVKLSRNYANHFSPEFFLPFNNQTNAFSFNRQGNFLLILIPFLLISFFATNKRDKLFWFFLAWLLIAPIPSALTKGAPNPNRCLIMLPALAFFTARGIILTMEFLSQKLKVKALFINLFFTLVFLINFGWYLHEWLIYFPEDSEHYWHGFYQQASLDVWQKRHNYNKVYFTTTDTQPYIFFAWYNQIDPALVQKNTNDRDEQLMEGIKQIDNLYFWPVKVNTAPCYLTEENVLVVASDNDKDAVNLKDFEPDFVYTRQNRFHPEEIALRAWESRNLTAKERSRFAELCQSQNK